MLAGRSGKIKKSAHILIVRKLRAAFARSLVQISSQEADARSPGRGLGPVDAGNVNSEITNRSKFIVPLGRPERAVGNWHRAENCHREKPDFLNLVTLGHSG
jgi:hypothetical protein